MDAPVQHVDLAPTVLDLVRAPGASSLSGQSVRGLLEGDAEQLAADAALRRGDVRGAAVRLARAERAGRRPTPPPPAPPRSPRTTPAIASDEEREALARLGDIAPTLRPLPAAAAVERPDPATMGPVLDAYARAARHDADRELGAAITAYRQVVELLPTDANAWYRIGLAAGRLGRTDQALAAFDRVEALRLRLGRRRARGRAARSRLRARRPGRGAGGRDPRHAAGDRAGADRGRRPCRAGDDRRQPPARRRRPARGGAGRGRRPRPAVRGVHRRAPAARSGRARGGTRRRSIAWSSALGDRPSPFDGPALVPRRHAGAARPSRRGADAAFERAIARRAVRPARLHQPGHAPAGDAAAATTRRPPSTSWCDACRRRLATPPRCGSARCSATASGPRSCAPRRASAWPASRRCGWSRARGFRSA